MLCVNFLHLYHLFSVPAPFGLFLETSLHKIKVTWEKPIFDSHCFMHYIIDWVQNQNGKYGSSIVSWEAHSFVIENLESFEEYEVSLRAVDENGDSSLSVTGKTKTVPKGKYTHHINSVLLGRKENNNLS
jgi:hypothetical protein